VTNVDIYRPRGGTEKILVTLLSRERAPHNSYRDMFVNRTGLSRIGSPCHIYPYPLPRQERFRMIL